MRKKLLASARVSIATLFLLFATNFAPVASVVYATKPVDNDPPGNNGTLKVHEFGTASGTESNDPKVCVFNFEGFGFDESQSGYIMVDVQGGSSPVGEDAGPFNFGPTNDEGYAQTEYFNNGTGPTIKNGTYKATLYGKDTGNNIDLKDEKAKSKVFKVECEEPPVDLCTNIDGVQTEVPEGMVRDEDGKCCTPPPVDVCPNIEGNQSEVPSGMVKDEHGDCVTPECPDDLPVLTLGRLSIVNDNNEEDCNPPVDVCKNLEGNQSEVPSGMVVDEEGNCNEPTPPTDVCPNIDGNQESIPAGKVKDSKGDCVTPEAGEVLGISTNKPAELANTGANPLVNMLLGLGIFTLAIGGSLLTRKQS